MSSQINSGMVLAAGLGTRMRPITNTIPKPLIPVAGRTMADRALDRLMDIGIERAVLNISYLADEIETHFQNRTDLDIRFSPEDKPLETGGGVQNALPLLTGDAFVIMNGDAVLLNGPTPALKRMADYMQAHENCDALLLLHPTTRALGYDGRGDFFLPDDVPAFRGSAEAAPYVFTGVQILKRHLFDTPQDGAWSLREIYERTIALKTCHALVHDGDWLHIGTPDGLDLATNYFSKRSGQ